MGNLHQVELSCHVVALIVLVVVMVVLWRYRHNEIAETLERITHIALVLLAIYAGLSATGAIAG